MDQVTIPIREAWRKQADAYAKATGMRSMRTGKLAEYAVVHYLRSEGVTLREDQTPTNRADHFDINLGNTLVDVKSCLAPATELRVTKTQFDRGKRFAFYIGVQMARNRETATIYGFCDAEMVKTAKTKKQGSRDVYVVPFSQLRPIQDLVQAFR